MERKPPARLTQEIYFWLQTFTIGLVAVILVFTFLGRPVVVDGDSMLPTLSHGDVMLVRQVGYTPQQGDVVVLTKYFEDVTGPIVKRVIATAGQTVEIDYAGNTVTVDGVGFGGGLYPGTHGTEKLADHHQHHCAGGLRLCHGGQPQYLQ